MEIKAQAGDIFINRQKYEDRRYNNAKLSLSPFVCSLFGALRRRSVPPKTKTMSPCITFPPHITLRVGPVTTRHPELCRSSLVPVRAIASAADSTMAAAGSVRVAAAQMTSINDLASNFTTCSRLVKVSFWIQIVIFRLYSDSSSSWFACR